MFNTTVDSILYKFHKLIDKLENHYDVSKSKADFHIEQHQIHFDEMQKARSVADKMREFIGA